MLIKVKNIRWSNKFSDLTRKEAAAEDNVTEQ